MVGKTSVPFLYDMDGPLVRFRPGASDRLLTLAPLIRSLVELHWVRMVAAINRLAVEEDLLHRHLFGAERIAFPPALRGALTELQDGRCFYCDTRLPQDSHIDHFLPWSRWPLDAIENLVVADKTCNGKKSNHVASAQYVDRWATRFETSAEDLAEIAANARCESDAVRGLAFFRNCYKHLPTGAPLWHLADEFVIDDPASIQKRLARIEN